MYVAHSLIIVATCHGMSNLVFSPSSDITKWHEGLSFKKEISLKFSIELHPSTLRQLKK